MRRVNLFQSLLVLLSFILSATPLLHAFDIPRPSVKQVLVVTEDSPDQVQQRAIQTFVNRFADRWKDPVQVLRESELQQGTVIDASFVLLVGRPVRHRLLAQILAAAGRAEPTLPDSYRLYSEASKSSVERLALRKVFAISGADSRGVLYGLGRTLRLLQQGSAGAELPELDELQVPAVSHRAVYFATHFQNFYETAPLDEIDSYIEEMALWGYNEIYVWFDMHWFPHGFWSDSKSQGSEMMGRLRHITETARTLGMQVGSIAVANEAFRNQPPAALRCDRSSARGAYYGDSQVCPLSPDGWKMIVEDREKVVHLLGPVDMWLYWPYDPGGCDCGPDGAKGWVDTFLKIGPDLSEILKKENPKTQFFISTWMFDDQEREKVYKLANERAEWFDGIVAATDSTPEPSTVEVAHFSDLVFPDISMFDNYSDCYGCNGANPAPERFTKEAKRIVKAGKGAVLYSEGFYDDVNKFVWARLMWNSDLSTKQIIDEYCSYYFGQGNRELASKLIFGLEETWGSEKLIRTGPEHARTLSAVATTLGENIIAAPWVQNRWRALSDRARMDELMVRIRSLGDYLRPARVLFEEAVYPKTLNELRRNTSEFCDRLDAREALIDQLFQSHQEYLRYFHIERFVYGFTPDSVLGKFNWTPLATRLKAALKLKNDEDMRKAIITSFRWWWFKGISTQEYFLF